MAEYEIDGIQWFDRALGHQGIQAVGNRAGKWGLTVASAILRIESGDRLFVLPMSGVPVNIKVVKPEAGTPYLRTFSKDRWTDHLLSLPVLPDVEMID